MLQVKKKRNKRLTKTSQSDIIRIKWHFTRLKVKQKKMKNIRFHSNYVAFVVEVKYILMFTIGDVNVTT